MPKSNHQSGANDDVYNETKGLRSSKTSKRLRQLRSFERINYKKTCEVKKTGHGLVDEHRLHDGNLRHTTNNLTYSLNKKKRWLLPDIIEQRICEHNPNSSSPKAQKGDQISSIDERLKIVMYTKENINYTSNCVRYANSQIEPHVIHKNGDRFNPDTLTKWINFDTRSHWRVDRRHRQRNDTEDRINQPNFGIQQRPGFFPSEVTYEFLYPKRMPESESHRNGKVSLSYYKGLQDDFCEGRHHKDTTKHRRKVRRNDCIHSQKYEERFDLEEDSDNGYEIMDENDKWSIVFEDFDDNLSASIEFPIDYFIPSSDSKSNSFSDEDTSNIITDHKAFKYFEPPSTSNKSNKKTSIINENLLCTIPCKNESEFISVMQKPSMNISQANLSPPIFIQTTSTSSFSVIYTYSRTSSNINATAKFADLRPNIPFDKTKITLEQLIELVSKKLDEYQINSTDKSTQFNRFLNVDALRGSLPLPLNITQNMILVQPNATDKRTALENENLTNNNQIQQEQWFNTLNDEYEMLECSICCEVLTANDAYQLLPCHHISCQSCLTSYIRTSISSATYSSSSTSPISCFQPNCSTHLNSSLLQAFVSFEIYRSYYQSLMDRQLFSSGHYRKCPSRACSNLLIVNNDTKSALMCSCGQRACSECLEEYHFPATCRQYKSYHARLRESSDNLLSTAKFGDNSSYYIAEGKNCPNCGEFVEKNGGCPHMTCKCGNEYCWMCLRRWAGHNSATCFNVSETIHELRSSTKNRLHNKAVNHRRQRNQYSFNLLSSNVRQAKISLSNHDLIVSTYIDMNTLAEFIYVLLQRRRTNVNIRAVLSRTANRLELDAFRIKLQAEHGQVKMDYIHEIRSRLERTVGNLLYMKNNRVLI